MRTAELMEFDEQSKVRRVLAHYTDDRSGDIHVPFCS